MPGDDTGAADAAWTVLYDGECGFCMWLMAGFLAWDRCGRLRPVALQCPETDALLRGIPVAARMESWHLVSPHGETSSGGAALAPFLRLLPAGRLPAAVADRFPVTTDHAYRWVAAHRSQLSRWVPSTWKRRARRRVQARAGAKSKGAGSATMR